MAPYLIVNFIIILSAIIFEVKIKDLNYNKISILYLSIIGILLTLFSGLRGDFTSDYKAYSYLFHFYNDFNFKKIFTYNFGQEIGYVILNKIVGILTNNVVFIMLLTSLIIVVLYFKEIKRDSVCIWLSVLLFTTIGQYYISFNLIRQIISAGIIFSGSRFLYKRDFKKYLVIIIIASLFHKTAAIMVVFYFILNQKFNFKKILLVILGTIIFFDFTNIILAFIQKFFYSYYNQSDYGMSGFSLNNIILPVAILAFVILNKNYIELNNNKVNIWTNAVVFYTFFTILGLRVQMIERLANFFSPYVLLLIPYIIMNMKDKCSKNIYILIFVFMSLVYCYYAYSGTGYDPFYFIWA